MEGVSTASLLLVTFTEPVTVPTIAVLSVTNLLIELGNKGAVPDAVPVTLPVQFTANNNGSTPVLLKYGATFCTFTSMEASALLMTRVGALTSEADILAGT